MSTFEVILIVVVALVVVLAIVGYLANTRWRRAEEDGLRERALQADHHLALAVAEDKGWERAGLEAAARDAYRTGHGADPRELTLVKVIDRPGVDEDEAVFDADGTEIVLARRGGTWAAV